MAKTLDAKDLRVWKATASFPDLVGFVNYSDDDSRKGLYHINDDGDFNVIESREAYCRSGLSIDGKYYNFCTIDAEPTVLVYDIEDDWNLIQTIPLSDHKMMPYTVATDGTTVWGTFDNGARQHEFGVFNLDDFTHSVIASKLSTNWNSLVISPEGQMYCIDIDGNLYKVDKSTGNTDFVGITYMEPTYPSGACIDPKTGICYWTVNSDWDTYLCEVDLNNGYADEIVRFYDADMVAGLVIPTKKRGGVPSAPSGLTASFLGGSTTGTISFTIPNTDPNGNTLSGEVKYNIFVNGVQVKSVASSYGAKVNETITVSAPGNYSFGVTATNASGASQMAQTEELYVGNDTPLAPATATAAWNGTSFSITWDAVAHGVHDGYIDASAMKYRVTRYPGATVVANGVTSTAFTDTFTEPEAMTSVSYTVEACFDGRYSQPTATNSTVLGAMLPPFCNPMDVETDLTGYTVIDANEDGKKWEYKYYPLERFAAVRVDNAWKPAKDDWLITPPVRLEAGKVYTFSLDAAGYNQFDENEELFTVMMGASTDPADLTTEVIPQTLVTKYAFTRFEGHVRVATTGKYYFGIHAVSERDKYILNVKNVAVSAPVEGDVPAAVADFAVAPAADGSLKASVTFTAPATTITGDPLASLDRIDVRRGDFVVKSFESPAPGAALSFIDELYEEGDYTYSAVAYNIFGASGAVTATTYIGVRIPGAVSDVVLVENDQTGNLTLSWNAPTATADGNPIDAAAVRYRLVDALTEKVIVDNYKGTEYTWQAVTTANYQRFMQVIVYPYTTKGDGQPAVSRMLTVGYPYQLPYAESFRGGVQHSLIAQETLEGDIEWGTWLDGNLGGLISSDADGGLIAAEGSARDDKALFYTGKIDLTNAVAPAFTFYLYNTFNPATGRANVNVVTVMAKVAGEEDWTELRSGTVDDLCHGDVLNWKLVKTPLTAYVGKVINLAIKVDLQLYLYTCVDQLRVDETIDNDLGIVRVEAPDRVIPGEAFNIAVRVRNYGNLAAESYSVELSRDGMAIATLDGTSLAPDDENTLTFSLSRNVTHPESHTYTATIISANDQNSANDESAEVVVKRKISRLPAPHTLSVVEEGGAKLAWSEPDMSLIPGEITDDFESYDPWQYSGFGNWQVYNADGVASGGINGIDIPGLTPGTTPTSFFTFDDTKFEGLKAHSGHRMLATMLCYDGGMADDWLISPRLYGQTQTVSFWARSYDDFDRESIFFLISTTDDNPESFYRIKAAIAIPTEWTFYSFELPAETEYFALRSCASNPYMLFVDDITYTPDRSMLRVPANFGVKGYNVYRDGEKINLMTVAQNAFVDSTVAPGSYEYQVSALYTTGEESQPTEAVSVMLGTNPAAAAVNMVKGVKGAVVINAVEPCTVSVANTAGAVIFNDIVAAGHISVNVAPGVYVVTLNGDVTKVVVR